MKFNNETLREAVKEWLDDDKLAELKYGHISNWDTSDITDMSCMFLDSHEFIQSIGNWDVSNVEYMSMMFYCAESFIHPIGDWDVSSVIDLSEPFNGADSLRF